eukprot:s54_g9.t1
MPTCPQPDVADATGDCRCEPSPDGCVCPVFCKHTHGNIKENVKEGDKKCTIEDKMPPAGTCNSFTTKDDCLSHSQDRSSRSRRVMPPSFSEARHVSASEACSGCIAGQPCDCEIKCEENFERVGGGQEGSRSCDINKLEFEDPERSATLSSKGGQARLPRGEVH